MKNLPYHYGIKMRFYPSDGQKIIIKVNSDASRFVYNAMVALDHEIYEIRRVKLPIDSLQSRLEQLKQRRNSRQLTNHYQFLADDRIDSLTKATAIQNHRKAWKAFRKVHTAGVPNFHHKSYAWKYQTCCQYVGQTAVSLTTGTVRFIDKNHILIPKIGVVRVSGSQRRLFKHNDDIRIGVVTVEKDSAGRFFISMQLGSAQTFVTKQSHNSNQVGIDLNTENFLTTSDGEVVDNPRYYRSVKARLAREQRCLSRRQHRAKKEHRPLRKSKNYQRQRLLVAKIHAKIRDQRNNFHQTLSTTLIKSHDLVVAEELRSKNLLKNHALAMSISDVGWRTFIEMLAYKAEMYGTTFITVNPRNTTQTCYDCGHIMGTGDTEKLTLRDRKWQCPKCHVSHIRDKNAAKNILAKGLQKQA